MRTIRLKISDLFEFEGQPVFGTLDIATVTVLARKQFGFLPQPVLVQDRKFSGLHLMCLMYAGFKRVAPEHEVQMDLNDPFLTALQMHKNGEGKP